MPEVMAASGQANGGAAGDRRLGESALCLPPLNFDYQLSSNSYESPRYRNTFLLALYQDVALTSHLEVGNTSIWAGSLGWDVLGAQGMTCWSVCCRPSSAPHGGSAPQGILDSDGDFAGFSTPPDILSPQRPASPEAQKHAASSSSSTSSHLVCCSSLSQ